MDYTDEELEALNEAHRQDSEEGFTMVRATRETLLLSNNDIPFDTIRAQLEKKAFLTLRFCIKEGYPYYQSEALPNGQKLYLNQHIVDFIYRYLENGEIASSDPKTYWGDVGATETYMLKLLQRDRQNKVTTYSDKEGYKAKYERGIIIYGYPEITPDQMEAKLSSL